MVFLKFILCLWTSLFLLLPGCLCQVLEPFGIHLPHHHHSDFVGYAVPQETDLSHRPLQQEEPIVPCHCDEQPDREADDCLAVSFETTPELQSVPWFILANTSSKISASHEFRQLSCRAPPLRLGSPAMMRKLLCVCLV
jgi:hypothetical protein